MKKTVHVCDKCKKDIPLAPDTLRIYLDREYNGTDHDDVYQYLDLCHKCCYDVIKKFFKDADGQTNKTLLKSVGLLDAWK